MVCCDRQVCTIVARFKFNEIIATFGKLGILRQVANRCNIICRIFGGVLDAPVGNIGFIIACVEQYDVFGFINGIFIAAAGVDLADDDICPGWRGRRGAVGTSGSV